MDAENERLEYIRECEGHCADAQEAVDDLKSQLRDAAQALTRAIDKLRAAARGDDMPLWELGNGADAWREAPMDVLDISSSTLELLKDNDIDSLGAYSTWCNAHTDGIAVIRGIGTTKAATINDAFVAWMREHGFES